MTARQSLKIACPLCGTPRRKRCTTAGTGVIVYDHLAQNFIAHEERMIAAAKGSRRRR